MLGAPEYSFLLWLMQAAETLPRSHLLVRVLIKYSSYMACPLHACGLCYRINTECNLKNDTDTGCTQC